VKHTSGVCDSECKAARCGGKKTGSDAANKGAYEMSVEDIESVVNVLEERQVPFSKIEGDL
jgi:hypothetical protein